MESSVTKPIEEAVNTISGIEDLSSTSYEGLSMIMIKFVLEKDGDIAAQDVRDKVNAVQRQLPQGTDPPVIGKFDVGAIPVVNVVVSGEKDLIELTRFAKKKIKENIETVDGVGSVDLVGGREREIHIVLNPLKMASLGISTKQVKDAIVQQNIEIPGGKVEQARKEFVLHPGPHQERKGLQLDSHNQRRRRPRKDLRRGPGGRYGPVHDHRFLP